MSFKAFLACFLIVHQVTALDIQMQQDKDLQGFQPPEPGKLVPSRHLDLDPEGGLADLHQQPKIVKRQAQEADVVQCESPSSVKEMKHGEKITFRSPTFPYNYRANQDCGWDLRGVDANIRFCISCKEFSVEKKYGRCPDYLRLQTTKFCGGDQKAPKEWRSSSRNLKMSFHSDDRRNQKGFSCTAEAYDAGYIPATYPHDVVQCGSPSSVKQMKDGEKIAFRSPTYPHNYRTYQDCGWDLQGEHVNIRFHVTCKKFSVEGRKNGVCPDYLRLQTTNYCGEYQYRPINFRSWSNNLKMSFHSDGRRNQKGFDCMAEAYDVTHG